MRDRLSLVQPTQSVSTSAVSCTPARARAFITSETAHAGILPDAGNVPGGSCMAWGCETLLWGQLASATRARPKKQAYVVDADERGC